MGGFRVVNLDALVRIKLTAYRDKDRTNLRDLIDIGLVDQSWASRLPPPLAARLQIILDTPDGWRLPPRAVRYAVGRTSSHRSPQRNALGECPKSEFA